VRNPILPYLANKRKPTRLAFEQNGIGLLTDCLSILAVKEPVKEVVLNLRANHFLKMPSLAKSSPT
jgi:hypothetical protein